MEDHIDGMKELVEFNRRRALAKKKAAEVRESHSERIALSPALQTERFKTLSRQIRKACNLCARPEVRLTERDSVSDFLLNEKYVTYDDFVESERYALTNLKASYNEITFNCMMRNLTNLFIMRKENQRVSKEVFKGFIDEFGYVPYCIDELYYKLTKVYGRKYADDTIPFFSHSTLSKEQLEQLS